MRLLLQAASDMHFLLVMTFVFPLLFCVFVTVFFIFVDFSRHFNNKVFMITIVIFYDNVVTSHFYENEFP